MEKAGWIPEKTWGKRGEEIPLPLLEIKPWKSRTYPFIILTEIPKLIQRLVLLFVIYDEAGEDGLQYVRGVKTCL
jgi:hypothetical protein